MRDRGMPFYRSREASTEITAENHSMESRGLVAMDRVINTKDRLTQDELERIRL